MKFIIIGLGYFGKIIRSKLPSDSEIFIVDPYVQSDYSSIDDVPFVDGKWFITTPASTHYNILCSLFKKGVKDIWVEKPICANFEDTVDIFAQIPDDVFLYCDFTWLKHPAVLSLGDYVYKNSAQHMELKWLNDGSQAPSDVNIVMDLVVHPISIVVFLLFKNKDFIRDVKIVYKNEKTVIIHGQSKKKCTFNIEVSNNSKTKMRHMSLYSAETLRWNSSNEFFIENMGTIEPSDAIQNNIKQFISGRCTNVCCLDIATILKIIDKQLSA